MRISAIGSSLSGTVCTASTIWRPTISSDERQRAARGAGAGGRRSSRARPAPGAYLSSAHVGVEPELDLRQHAEPEDEYELAVGREEPPGHALTLAQKSARVVGRAGDARIAPHGRRRDRLPAAMSPVRRRLLASVSSTSTERNAHDSLATDHRSASASPRRFSPPSRSRRRTSSARPARTAAGPSTSITLAVSLLVAIGLFGWVIPRTDAARKDRPRGRRARAAVDRRLLDRAPVRARPGGHRPRPARPRSGGDPNARRRSRSFSGVLATAGAIAAVVGDQMA